VSKDFGFVSRSRESVKVKTARGRKISSSNWLRRQLNDPFTQQAKLDGYRSRASYKLIEIEQKFSIFKNVGAVVDLGAAPGSWSQVAIELMQKKSKLVIALDLLEIEPMENVKILQGDFLDEKIFDQLFALSKDGIDVVMSDMAASSTGNSNDDHLKICDLCDYALDFAIKVLNPNGSFITKMLFGGGEKVFFKNVQMYFEMVKFFKPQASRKDSAEIYIVAKGFRGNETKGSGLDIN